MLLLIVVTVLSTSRRVMGEKRADVKLNCDGNLAINPPKGIVRVSTYPFSQLTFRAQKKTEYSLFPTELQQRGRCCHQGGLRVRLIQHNHFFGG